MLEYTSGATQLSQEDQRVTITMLTPWCYTFVILWAPFFISVVQAYIAVLLSKWKSRKEMNCVLQRKEGVSFGGQAIMRIVRDIT